MTTELADQTFQVFDNRGSVDIFVDVAGYDEHHDHGDRYSTQDQADARFDRPRFVPLAADFEVSATGANRFDDSVIMPEDYTPGANPRVD